MLTRCDIATLPNGCRAQLSRLKSFKTANIIATGRRWHDRRGYEFYAAKYGHSWVDRKSGQRGMSEFWTIRAGCRTFFTLNSALAHYNKAWVERKTRFYSLLWVKDNQKECRRILREIAKVLGENKFMLAGDLYPNRRFN